MLLYLQPLITGKTLIHDTLSSATLYQTLIESNSSKNLLDNLSNLSMEVAANMINCFNSLDSNISSHLDIKVLLENCPAFQKMLSY
jgi:hypothetical protein